MSTPRLFLRVVLSLVLSVSASQCVAQNVLEHWDEGLRITASIPYNGANITSDFKAALPSHLTYLADVLIAERFRELGLYQKALAQLEGMSFEKDPAAFFWASFVRANAYDNAGMSVDAAIEIREMLAFAEDSQNPALVSIAEYEWVQNLGVSLHGDPPASVGARARVGLASIAPEAVRYWMLARSIVIMDIPDTVHTELLAMQRYHDYFKANNLPAMELIVASNLAVLHNLRREYDEGNAMLERTREVSRQMNDTLELWGVTNRYGELAYKAKDYDRAIDSLDAAYPFFLEKHVVRLAGMNRYYKAKSEYYRSDSDTAGLALFHVSLDLAEQARYVNLFQHDVEWLTYLYMSEDIPDAPEIVEGLLKRTWDFHRKHSPEGTGSALEKLRMTDLEVEAARADQEKAKRELAENRSRSLVFGLVAAGLLLVLLIGFWRIQTVRQQEKLAAEQELHRETELRAEQEVQEMIARHRFENLVANIEGEEQERERIAQELHDHIGGTLGILAAQLQGESPISAQDGNRIGNQLNTVYNDLRALSHSLKLPDTQQNALADLTKALLANLERSGDVETQLAVFPPNRTVDLPDQVEVQVFRVLQELSHNVIKHAKAKTVEVSMTRRADGFAVIFEDDGVGFDPNQPDKTGMGLVGMRNRIESLSGTFHIDSQPGRGAIFSIDIPLS